MKRSRSDEVSSRRSSTSSSGKKVRGTPFCLGGQVLVRWSDGIFYFGKLWKFDHKTQKCCIRFENDSINYWVMMKDIQKGPTEDEIVCVICQSEDSIEPNEIVLCDNCGLGYHQRCHNPVIDEAVLKPDVEWFCRQCVPFTENSMKGSTRSHKQEVPGQSVIQSYKHSLPYDPNSLTWDIGHMSNVEDCYCYCGGPGEWFKRMLQCCRCQQWFHDACIQAVHYPLLYGDRYFIFVCSHCNSGTEYIKRLELKWLDITYLVLFHLTVEYNLKYYDLHDTILPFLDEHWTWLQAGKLQKANWQHRKTHISSCLENYPSCFKNGRELRKRITLYGIRERRPPSAPPISIPDIGPVTEERMNNLKNIQTKTYIQHNSLQPIPYLKRAGVGDRPDDISNPKPTRQPHKKLRRKLKSTLTKEPSTESVGVADDSPPKENMDVDDMDAETEKGSIANDAPEEEKDSEDLRVDENQNCESTLVLPTDDATGSSSFNWFDSPTPSKRDVLDRIIPRPTNFDGYNHPFKTVLERNQEIETTRMKARLLYSYTNGYINGDLDSELSWTDSQTETEDSDMTSVTQSETSSIVELGQSRPKKRKRGRPTKLEQAYRNAIAAGTSIAKRQCPSQPVTVAPATANVVDTNTLDSVSKREVSMNQLRSSVNNYFGAANRLANGEGFQVLARRVTPGGKVQYLVEWEGGIIG